MKKMGVAASATKSVVKTTESTSSKAIGPPPMWIYTAQISGDTSQDTFGAVSPGMQLLGPNTVVRQRKGQFDTDGAQWKRGFTEGKHIFEIVYPVSQRGQFASVGIGTDEAPVHQRGKMSLVGSNAFSWGIDLRTRRANHRKAIVGKYPTTMVYLPDKFYMYLDIDSGTLQFGSDYTYYGISHTNIKPGKALYPMVCSAVQGTTITMVYRGQGDPSRISNVGMAMTPAGPPLQHPEPRKAPPPMDPAPKEAPPPYMEIAGREGTTMSKMTDAGPPPPPPTQIGNQQGAMAASPTQEKTEVDPIPEETPKPEENQTDEKK